MKHVVVLGAGLCQLNLVEHLLKHEYYVTVVSPNQTNTSRLANNWLNIDAFDISNIICKLKNSNVPVDLVVTDQSEQLLKPVQEISHALKTPCINMDILNIYCNKLELYKTAVKHNIPTPVHYFDIKDISYPCVVKPITGTGSVDVRRVNNVTSLDHDTCIYQQYIQGREFSVEGICLNGDHETLIIGEKQHNEFAIGSHIKYPACITDKLKHMITNLNNRFIHATKLENSFTHTEWLVVNDNIYLIDAACRGGGAKILSDITLPMTNPQLREVLISNNHSTRDSLPILVASDNHRIITFPNIYTGVNNSDIKSFPGVVSSDIFIDNIKHHPIPENKYQRHSIITIEGSTDMQVRERHNQLLNALR
jgi:predicted ATP-grasp superfamily ATP-dependent carboligase